MTCGLEDMSETVDVSSLFSGNQLPLGDYEEEEEEEEQEMDVRDVKNGRSTREPWRGRTSETESRDPQWLVVVLIVQ